MNGLGVTVLGALDNRVIIQVAIVAVLCQLNEPGSKASQTMT